MPLRSVEAASRDAAITAAKEQFGTTARVVGVRKVRSGGVLGFFATERYVAEVEATTGERPAVPPAARPRATSDIPLEERARAAAASIARLAAAEAKGDPVDELAGLLGGLAPAADDAPVYTRASFQKAVAADTSHEAAAKSATFSAFSPAPAAATRGAGRVRPAAHEGPADGVGPVGPASGESPSPSPFTAALARMVAGDRDVRQAVEHAIDDPADEHGQEPSRPDRPGTATADQQAQSGAGHQEEEPVDERSEPVADSGARPVVFPAWAAPTDVAAAPEAEPVADGGTPREEAVADILRNALAQGESDEALADILRRVLAGSSTSGVALDVDTAAAPVDLPEPPLAELPLEPLGEPEVGPVAELPLEPVVPEVVAAAPEPTDDEPIFAEVVLHEPAPAPVLDAPVAHAPVAEAPVAPAPRFGTAASETPLFAPAVAASPVVEAPAVASPVVEEPVVEAPVVEAPVVETVVAAAPVAEAMTLARTASDPAPLPLDATTVMPRVSLLGAPSRSGGGLPPVPPSMSRPPVPPARTRASSSAPSAPTSLPMPPTAAAPLARVVRLPLPPLPETAEDEAPAPVEAAAGARTAPLPAVAGRDDDLVRRLTSLGLPEQLLGAGFAAEAGVTGTYAALTRALAGRLPAAPELPTGPGEVLFLVGPGVETLRAARSLAASLRLDPERVQWATRGDLAGLAPKSSRMTTIEAAIERRQDAARGGTMTIVAVDAPLRTDAYWMSQMLAIWSPAAVWAVVEATRKPEDLEQWLGGLPRVDALVVQDTDLSADPAAVLGRLSTPVALLDGVPATPHRWASLLCERLENAPA